MIPAILSGLIAARGGIRRPEEDTLIINEETELTTCARGPVTSRCAYDPVRLAFPSARDAGDAGTISTIPA